MKYEKNVLFLSLALNLLLIGSLGLYFVKKASSKPVSVPKSVLTESVYGRRLRMSSLGGIPVRHHKILMLGDSLTANAEWSEVLPGVDIENRGIGGEHVEGIADRLDADIECKPEKIFLMVGVNNLLYGSSADDLANKIAVLTATIHGKLPKATIYVESILPVNFASGVANPEADAARVPADLNSKIVSANKAISGIPGIRYIDVGASMNILGELKPNFTSDGVHLTGAGYCAWVKVLKPYLN